MDGQTIVSNVNTNGSITSNVIAPAITFQSNITPGAIGPQGPAGQTGAAGAPGANGAPGAQGATGPNTVSGSTTTTLSGLLKGTGSVVAVATAGTDYQAPLTLTTTGSSGAATLIGTTLNIPQYSGGGGGMSNPMTTLGDIITGASSGTAQRLAVGSTGQALKVIGGIPVWGQGVYFNVKDYGAVGDNSHDDTSAIQAAITAALATYNNSACVYFPAGMYKITSSLTCTSATGSGGLGVYLRGDGHQASRISKSFSTTAAVTFNGSGGPSTNPTAHGGMADISIEGNGNSGPLLQLNSAQQMFFRGVSFTGCADVTLDLNTVQDTHFEQVTLVTNGTSTKPVIKIYGSSGGTSNMLWFSQVRCEDFFYHGVEITRGSGATGGGNNGFFFDELKLESGKVNGDLFYADGYTQQLVMDKVFLSAWAFNSGYSTPANLITFGDGSTGSGSNMASFTNVFGDGSTCVNSVINIAGTSGGAFEGPVKLDNVYSDAGGTLTGVIVANSVSAMSFEVGAIHSEGATTFGGDGSLTATFGASHIPSARLYLNSTAYLDGGTAGALGVTGKLNTIASATGAAGLNIPSGTAPTSPTSGDMWYDGTHLQFRNGATTYQLDQQSGGGGGGALTGTSLTVTAATGGTNAIIASSNGTATAGGAFVYNQNGQSSWFGIYDSGGGLYYGISRALPAPSGTSTLGGYYNGLGVGGSSSSGGNPIFGVLNSAQSGNGLGATAFTVLDTNVITSFNNTLDDGSGNMTIAGNLTLSTKNIVTDTTTGTKIGTANTQKLGFFGATPVGQPNATTDLGSLLGSLGLRAAGSAYPLTTSGAVTLTGVLKTITLQPTIQTVTVSSNAGTVAGSTANVSKFTNSSAATMTITMSTGGSPVQGQIAWVMIYDFSATSETITWVNTENSGVSAPTTSNGSTTLPKIAAFMYNSGSSKWRCIISV